MLDLPVVPCPSWCRRPPGHELSLADRDVGGVARRIHLGVRDDVGRELEQFETVTADGQVTQSGVFVFSPAGRVPVDSLDSLLVGVSG